MSSNIDGTPIMVGDELSGAGTYINHTAAQIAGQLQKLVAQLQPIAETWTSASSPASRAASATFRAPSTWTLRMFEPNTPQRLTTAVAPSAARRTLSAFVTSAFTKPNWPTWPSG